eukprot:TRINITY_DN2398_c0_g1_i1.p1 TRINITY_DN2398_c0_g1~~TRINITY_DN2398_c0_g1_i1.p1  ORF type:complete len:540 (-),score=123.03 TRINITY_DN2398_c0_g1_i1:129-1748(-)
MAPEAMANSRERSRSRSSKEAARSVNNGNVSWDRDGEAYFSMGEGTLRVPMRMHRRKREQLCAKLRARSELAGGQGAVVVLQGGDEQSKYDTDTNWDFRQESNFQYLFGVKEPGCFAALRVSDARSVLFIPHHPPEYAAWMGPIKPPAWFHKAYGVDEVAYVEDISKMLEETLKARTLLFYRGVNRDSGGSLPAPQFEGSARFRVSEEGSNALWEELGECRLQKCEDEQRVLQYASDVSSMAHIEVMRGGAAAAGMREFISEATFKYQAAIRGCVRVGYDCICPTGSRNTALHYGHAAEPNAELVESGKLKLHDMGAEYHCYCADITCTFPVDGKFDDASKVVYETVWAAVQAVERQLRPGVSYKDMHRLAERTMLECMRDAGLFRGDIDDMMAAHLMTVFMPHGLGHNLGLDVHDVAGYEPGKSRKDDPSILQNLRLGRTLKKDMVLTVEPGFYFPDFLVDAALQDPAKARFINAERLAELRPVGGVRIEDNVVITERGCRVLTNVPRTVTEIEAVMAGKHWLVGSATCREYVAEGGS